MKTLAVVGTLVRDRIEGLAGGPVRAWGGIAYAVEAAATVAAGRLRVLPVCRVAAAERSALERRWRRLPGIALEGLVAWPGRQTSVRLHYRAPAAAAAAAGGDRRERLAHAQPPLGRAELAAAAGADGLLLNCISGFDVTRAGALALARTAGWLYLDLHSLLLGRGPRGERFVRRPLDLDGWLAAPDVVQCNRAELAVAAGQRVGVRRAAGASEGPDGSEVPGGRTVGPAEQALERQAALLLAAGVRALLVTEGAHGATLYTSDGERTAIPAPAVHLLDPTGAGDTFGAAFCVARLLGAGVRRAARYAVAVASAACAEQGPGRLGALPPLE